MTRTGAAARPDLEERAQSIREWAEMHSRLLTIIAVIIVLIVGGGWFYTKSRQVQARNAAVMLNDAELALGSGNAALAQSNLEKIVDRYSGTRSANQARLLLAQVLYDKGQYQKGIEDLQGLTKSSDKYLRANAFNLIGAGEEQAGRFAEAAAAYRMAADAAASTADRDRYLASAGRALMSGGKTAEAKEIWTKLAQDPGSQLSAEAKVRLGEIEAQKVGS
jgi:predicted negative regulator of RcsB-dependent stress response